jgi:hypothetical protein
MEDKNGEWGDNSGPLAEGTVTIRATKHGESGWVVLLRRDEDAIGGWAACNDGW